VVPRRNASEARERLGIPRDRFVVATLGVVTPAKRVSALVEALALLPAAERPFLFVGGAVSADDALRELVRTRGLESDIVFSGYLEEADFFRAASAADLAANLRHPTMGETSGAVCRLAGMGLPVLVSATGWFQELPDSFASKIPVGSGEIPRLAEELRRLAGSPGETAARGAAARAWGAERRPEHVAAAYAKTVGAVLAGEAPTRGLASRVAYELSVLGVGCAGVFGTGDRTADARIVASVAARSASVLPEQHEPIGS
jgi:glycosyltransferase involved in cell wall biosynthesis